jgi:hypothetical protein
MAKNKSTKKPVKKQSTPMKESVMMMQPMMSEKEMKRKMILYRWKKSFF